MLKRLASFVLVCALVCAVGGTSAFASSPSEPAAKSGGATSTQPASGAESGREAARNERVKAKMLKLIADAKTGNDMSRAPAAYQPPQSNSLSKGTKIAIGVTIAVVVIVAIVVATKANNGPGGNIRIF
jgi:hypothetical protein